MFFKTIANACIPLLVFLTSILLITILTTGSTSISFVNFILICIFFISLLFFGLLESGALSRDLAIALEYLSDDKKPNKLNGLHEKIFSEDKLNPLRDEFVFDIRLSKIKAEMAPVFRVMLDHGPAFFTGLGILFTFWGLISGLQGLNLSGTSNDASLSMSNLISGIGVAFSSSLIGITTSLGALFSIKISENSIKMNCQKIRTEIMRINAPRSPASILKKATKKLGAITNTLQALESTQRELLTTSKKQHDKVASLASDVATALEERFTEPLTNLSNRLDTMASANTEAHAQALDQVMSGFMEGFDQRLGEQLGELGEVLEQTLEWHQRAHASFGEAARALEEASASQQEVNLKQVEYIEAQMAVDARRHAAMTETTEALEGSAQELHSFVGSLEQNNEQWAAISEDLDAAIRSVQQTLSAMDQERAQLREAVDGMRDGASAWKEELELTSARYEELSRGLREGLHAGLRQTFETFDTESSKVVDRLGGSYLQIEDSLKNMESLLTNLDGLREDDRAAPTPGRSGSTKVMPRQSPRPNKE